MQPGHGDRRDVVQGGSSFLQALKQLLSTRTQHTPKKSSRTRNQAATRPCDQWRGWSLEQEQKSGQGGLKWFSKEVCWVRKHNQAGQVLGMAQKYLPTFTSVAPRASDLSLERPNPFPTHCIALRSCAGKFWPVSSFQSPTLGPWEPNPAQPLGLRTK